MPVDRLRALKVQTLRDAAEELRREAAAGMSPASNLLFADLLTRRANRVAAGEEDHSEIFRDTHRPPTAH